MNLEFMFLDKGIKLSERYIVELEVPCDNISNINIEKILEESMINEISNKLISDISSLSKVEYFETNSSYDIPDNMVNYILSLCHKNNCNNIIVGNNVSRLLSFNTNFEYISDSSDFGINKFIFKYGIMCDINIYVDSNKRWNDFSILILDKINYNLDNIILKKSEYFDNIRQLRVYSKEFNFSFTPVESILLNWINPDNIKKHYKYVRSKKIKTLL